MNKIYWLRDFITDAFVLFLSGAGTWKNKKEMWFTDPVKNVDSTIEFINGPKNCIIRYYEGTDVYVAKCKNYSYCGNTIRKKIEP